MRVKRGTKARARRKKVLKRAKGYYSSSSRSYTSAVERNDRALAFAYRDRKVRKREFRILWIQRINAAVRPYGLNYSGFIHSVQQMNLGLNRKSLAEMAVRDPEGFAMIAQKAAQSKPAPAQKSADA